MHEREMVEGGVRGGREGGHERGGKGKAVRGAIEGKGMRRRQGRERGSQSVGRRRQEKEDDYEGGGE